MEIVMDLLAFVLDPREDLLQAFDRSQHGVHFGLEGREVVFFEIATNRVIPVSLSVRPMRPELSG